MSITLAQQFATLLDNNHFDEAAKLIADDCHYKYFEGNYQGANNIMNLYRQNHIQATKIFDELVYTSSVEDIGENTYKINFTDKIRKAVLWHEHNCYQLIKVEDDRIIDIEHHDIPGEQETLRAFYGKVTSMVSL